VRQISVVELAAMAEHWKIFLFINFLLYRGEFKEIKIQKCVARACPAVSRQRYLVANLLSLVKSFFS